MARRAPHRSARRPPAREHSLLAESARPKDRPDGGGVQAVIVAHGAGKKGNDCVEAEIENELGAEQGPRFTSVAAKRH